MELRAGKEKTGSAKLGPKYLHVGRTKMISMRCLISLVSVASVSLAAELLPTFSLLQDRSADGSPSVGLTLPDGRSDTILLERFYASEDDKLNDTDAGKGV